MEIIDVRNKETKKIRLSKTLTINEKKNKKMEG